MELSTVSSMTGSQPSVMISVKLIRSNLWGTKYETELQTNNHDRPGFSVYLGFLADVRQYHTTDLKKLFRSG